MALIESSKSGALLPNLPNGCSFIRLLWSEFKGSRCPKPPNKLHPIPLIKDTSRNATLLCRVSEDVPHKTYWLCHFHRSRVTVDLCFRWLQHKTNRCRGREGGAFALSNTDNFLSNRIKTGRKREASEGGRVSKQRTDERWSFVVILSRSTGIG